MSPVSWISIVLLAALPYSAGAASAQTERSQTDPTVVAAAVPPPTYGAALQAYKPATDEPDTTPDTLWHAANREVGQLGGHGGHLGGSYLAPADRQAGHGLHRHGE